MKIAAMPEAAAPRIHGVHFFREELFFVDGSGPVLVSDWSDWSNVRDLGLPVWSGLPDVDDFFLDRFYWMDVHSYR